MRGQGGGGGGQGDGGLLAEHQTSHQPLVTPKRQKSHWTAAVAGRTMTAVAARVKPQQKAGRVVVGAEAEKQPTWRLL